MSSEKRDLNSFKYTVSYQKAKKKKKDTSLQLINKY